jgi:hypothetical protein
MFNSDVEDNIQVSLKRSDAKKELSLLPVLTPVIILSILFNLMIPHIALKKPIMILSKRKLQALVVAVFIKIIEW